MTDLSPPSSGLASFVDVVVRFGLADLEALLLLDILRRWPTESFGGGTIMQVRTAQEAVVLRVSAEAVHGALWRLDRRSLISVERVRARLHVRLTLGLQIVARQTACDPIVMDRAFAILLRSRPSQGRDRILLMELISRAAPDDPVVRVSVRELASRLGIARQSVTRIVTRLARAGTVRRTPDGIEVFALQPPGGATSS